MERDDACDDLPGSGCDLTLARDALGGDEAARTELAQRITPVFRHRVRRALLRHTRARERHPTDDDVAELVQEVQLLWWTQSERMLLRWDPGRGLSLRNFAGLFAERAAISILRSGRRSAWAERPVDQARLYGVPATHDPEHMLSARQQLRTVLARIELRVSARSLALFGALITEGCSVDELSRRLGTSENAIYCALSRVRCALREVARDLEYSDGGEGT